MGALPENGDIKRVIQLAASYCKWLLQSV